MAVAGAQTLAAERAKRLRPGEYPDPGGPCCRRGIRSATGSWSRSSATVPGSCRSRLGADGSPLLVCRDAGAGEWSISELRVPQTTPWCDPFRSSWLFSCSASRYVGKGAGLRQPRGRDRLCRAARASAKAGPCPAKGEVPGRRRQDDHEETHLATRTVRSRFPHHGVRSHSPARKVRSRSRTEGAWVPRDTSDGTFPNYYRDCPADRHPGCAATTLHTEITPARWLYLVCAAHLCSKGCSR
jgi:hypothetical protein